MKKLMLLAPFYLFISLASAQFKAGEQVTIDDPYHGDLYVAGGTIDVNSPVYGDLVAAGGEVSIGDSILQDLLVTGGKINLLAPVMDDVRAAGGDISIHSYVGDDLLVMGGNVLIRQDAKILGNLVVFGGNIKSNGEISGNFYGYGGEVNIAGTVGQNIVVKGGNIQLNGKVGGSVEAAADDIQLGNATRINGDFSYWTEDGRQDFDKGLVGGAIYFDTDLEIDAGPSPWWLGGMAVGLFFWYVFAAFLLILVIQLLFGRKLAEAASSLMGKIGENIGYGVLYIFGVPIVVVILFGLFIGIPIGLFILFLYLFSLLFGYAIASLLFIHHLNNKRSNTWPPIIIILLALLVVFGLRVVTFIPLLGWLIGLLVLGWTYGALINHYLKSRKLSNTEK